MSLSDNQDVAWFPDIGESANISSNPSTLHPLSHYFGHKRNGWKWQGLRHITHVALASMEVSRHYLPLNNVLVVLEIEKILLFVIQMTFEHLYVFEVSFCGLLMADAN